VVALAAVARRTYHNWSGASVTDGDTLLVLQDKRQISIRLLDIDAPERAQPFGKQSTESLMALCASKTARVEWNNIDAYNRILGRVWCDGVDANKEQVRRGMAWVFVRYAARNSPLYSEEAAARQARLGLWSDENPVPPWDWRTEQRAQ
jgi:endonuclease YncB( thermonuclease family)